MASADVCDIPQMQSPRPVKVSKRTAEQDSTESKKPRFDFSQQIRDSPPWFANMQAANFKNVTKPASRRTLFVLTAEDGTDQFCVVGRVMSSRLSEQELSEPSKFEGSDEHTDLELQLTLRESNSDFPIWPGVNSDTAQAMDVLSSMRGKAMETFTELFKGDCDAVTGLKPDKLAKFKKNKKNPQKIMDSLDEQWGGTGLNPNGDIVRLKRRCYNVNDLSNSRVFMDKWLQVTDDTGNEIDYIKEDGAIEHGDLVLVWFRTLAQCVANNFHVALEPRSVMRLAKGSAGNDNAGSFGFAAAMAKAMQRDSDQSI